MSASPASYASAEDLLHVLLVEDDDAHAELILRAFESSGEAARVTVAANLREAGLRLAEQAPDLVIVDFRLPDGDGMELLRPAPYPIVLMTAHGNEQVAVEAIKAGALDYVVKSEETFRDMPHIARRAVREWDHIRKRRQAEAALRISEQRYRFLYDDNPSMFFTVNEPGMILSVNRYGAQQLGYSVEELTGRPLAELHMEAEQPAVAEHLQVCFQQPGIVHRWESRKVCKDGSLLWVRETIRVTRDSGGEARALVVCEDVTEAHELSEQLSHQASHDALTGLVNRTAFEQHLAWLLDKAQAEHSEHVLCYLDLDQFKVVNDTCGHIAGDELLRQLCNLLPARVRKQDTLARLGGDEFAILMEYCSLPQAHRAVEDIRRMIAQFHFAWEDKRFNVGASIGLVPIDESSTTVAAVLSAADSACYAAKDAGRNRVHVYHPEDTELAKRHREMQWVDRLTRALAEDRFTLFFQPIVPIHNGVAGGTHYELLLRMRDRAGNEIAPGAFLSAAERYALATRLDRWVIRTALSRLARQPEHLRQLYLCAINLSGQSLADEEMLRFIVEQIHRTGVPGRKLCFEITETAAIANLSGANRFIQVLQGLGCSFALDDFGSGLSSFAYLKNLPLEFVKIDGLFVKNIVNDPIDLAMVKSINEIGQVMGKRTVAEFVESRAIFEKLRAIGVDLAQGYALGRPQPLETLLKAL